MIRLDKISKQYHEGSTSRQVLDELTFTAACGEHVALVGSSGTGKSTLLNIISGIEQPDYGQVWINGTDLQDLSEPERTRWRRRNIGFVFQFFNLISTLTVAENALLPLTLNRLADQQERQRTLALLDQVGLRGRHDSFPERLSGGEQQRLAIVRALAHRPALVLADEPTGNLDDATGRQILDLFLGLARNQAVTVIMVTHSDVVAQRADRILRLAQGRLGLAAGV